MSFYRQLRQNLHPLQDNTTVDLYTSTAWPANGRATQPLPPAAAPRPSISLIATVRNERVSISAWLNSLLAQTRPPDEVVIVDGGSTDGTFELLQAFAEQSPVPVKVWQVPGANIAKGRNLAIEAAAGPLIACTDAGCLVPPDWLATITGPFAADSTLEVVAGYYEAIQHNDLQRLVAAYLVVPPHLVDPQSFLPSARSLAFGKDAWRKTGGFPEWLTLTAEDTLFDVALKKCTRRWAFVPEAVVRWQLKSTVPQLFRQVRAYGRGDGEAGLFPEMYWNHLQLWLGISVAGLVGLICLVLAVINRSWYWFVAGLLPAFWLARRFWRITLRPSLRLDSGETWPQGFWQKTRTFFLSMLVISAITSGLTIGFIEGVQRRKAISIKKARG